MSSGNGVRRCEGCSGRLAGRQQRFCGDRCRSRVRRSGRSDAVTTAVEAGHGGRVVSLPSPDPPAAEPGGCARGLEAWLAGIEDDLPAASVAHARLLAAEVDRDPANSPLHGRYGTALLALTDAAGVTQAREQWELATGPLWQVETGCDEHAHGVQRMTHCALCCDGRARRCVKGDHELSPYEPVHCYHCGTVVGTDGREAMR